MQGLVGLVISVVVTIAVVVLILSVERRRAQGIRRDLRADALRDRAAAKDAEHRQDRDEDGPRA